jgi:hypothetical protein
MKASVKTWHFLADFRTIGIDTEPALSFLKKTYPDQVNISSFIERLLNK